MFQIIYVYFQYLTLFLSLGVATPEAREIAAQETATRIADLLVQLDVGDVPVDHDGVLWDADIYDKPGCSPITGPKVCAGATCSAKCNQRRCCKWVRIDNKLVQRCNVEIDPATCVSNFPING